MATFAVYNYTFRDVENIGFFMGQEDDTSPLPTTEAKQNFVQQIFRDHLHGGREFECLTTEEQKTATGKRERCTTKYGCKVVWEKYGLIILMVSNPQKTITKHKNFQIQKELPSL